MSNPQLKIGEINQHLDSGAKLRRVVCLISWTDDDDAKSANSHEIEGSNLFESHDVPESQVQCNCPRFLCHFPIRQRSSSSQL